MAISDDKSDVKSTAHGVAASLIDSGSAALTSVSHEFKDIASSATDSAMTQAKAHAEDGRDRLAEETRRFADGLRSSPDSADGKSLQGRVMNTVADGISELSEELRDRSVASLWDDVQDMARKNPGAFVAAAGVLGFAAARFMMATEDKARHGNYSNAHLDRDVRSNEQRKSSRYQPGGTASGRS